jgi:hypothetical protein
MRFFRKATLKATKKTPTQLKSDYLEKTYGIDLTEYERLFEQQGGKCDICGNPPKSKALAVDHDHESGAVRSLLCFRCNKFMIGGLERMYKKPRDILKKINEYFEKHPIKGDNPARAVSKRKSKKAA